MRILKLNIIPIVMDDVDFRNIVPKDTFIDVGDYRSLRYLSDFLLKLMENRNVYNNYIGNNK